MKRGRYLAYSAAGCAYCHLPKSEWARLDAGEQPPLSGNHVFPLPFGELHSPNLTPDATTGIGRRSDGDRAHSSRGSRGERVGPPFAGGQVMDIKDDPGHLFVTPNLTPDPATGHIYSWWEDDFVARFRKGRIREVALMPWGSYARMTEDDLRSIYRYLRTLPPTVNQVEEIYRVKR